MLLSSLHCINCINISQMSTYNGLQCFNVALKCNFCDYEEVEQFLYYYLC